MPVVFISERLRPKSPFVAVAACCSCVTAVDNDWKLASCVR